VLSLFLFLFLRERQSDCSRKLRGGFIGVFDFIVFSHESILVIFVLAMMISSS